MRTPKTKGTVMIPMVKMLRSQADRSRSILPEHLHHYLEERILPTQWYPEEDLVQMLRAGLELMGLPEEQGLELMGISSATEHFRDVFGAAETPPEPEKVFMRLSAFWSIQHDTGRHRFVAESPTSGRIEIGGFGHPSKEMCAIVGAYSRELLRLAGLGEATVEKLTCVLEGDDHCSWRHTWEKPVHLLAPETRGTR